MWKQYRKTWIPTQVVILTICVLMVVFGGAPASAILMFFLMMQVFAILGARWAVRLKQKSGASHDDALPLRPR